MRPSFLKTDCTMRRVGRKSTIAFLLAALATGCSSIQIGYGQLDRLIFWYADDYLPLTAAQEAVLKPRVANLIEWHCSTQLPAYADWLRGVGAELSVGSSPERLDARLEQAGQFMREIARAAVPDAGVLLAGVSEEQVTALREAMEQRNREYFKKWVEKPPRELENARSKHLRKRVKAWIGSLNPAQEQAIDAWARGIEKTGEDALESRRRWQAALGETLSRRKTNPAFTAELMAIFVHPENFWTAAYARKLEANRELTLNTLLVIAESMDEKQRGRLSREVNAMAGDLEKLACVNQPASAVQLGAVPLLSLALMPR